MHLLSIALLMSTPTHWWPASVKASPLSPDPQLHHTMLGQEMRQAIVEIAIVCDAAVGLDWVEKL